MNNYWVYILTNHDNQVLYIGMTNNLARRIYEHQNGMCDGFSKTYNLDKLVYHEHFTQVEAAIAREKQLKGWRREKKGILIEALNPGWKDLSDSISAT